MESMLIHSLSFTAITPDRRYIPASSSIGQSTLKMPPPNGNAGPNERTSLLRKDIPKSIEPSFGDAITPETFVTGTGPISKGDGRDEEEGEVEGANPLFEGNDKAAQKMYLLFPAVSIGVRTLFCHLCTGENS